MIRTGLRRACFLVLLLVLPWRESPAQHDPGRDAVRLLARGQLKKARQVVGQPARAQHSPISEAERRFVLAIAAAQAGDAPAAIADLKQAVSLGLPVERVLAGPRDLLAPLADDPSFRAWLADRRTPLLHGPMLGAVTDASASLWVRTATPARVEATVYDTDGSTRIATSGVATSSPQTDYTAVVQLGGLRAATGYRYQIRIDGEPVGQPVAFRTYPQRGSPARIVIGFGGGAGYTPQFRRMWQTIRRHQPAAFLMLGDNVYIDDPTHPLTQHYCYYRRQSEPLWRSLIASTCMYSIYDDHDFGENDCIPGPEIARPAWKRSVWNVFRQNWINPAFGGGAEQPGCWYDFMIGDVHFLMLDGRYYRDLRGGTMLGPVQKQWLRETLSASQGTFKLLVSPVPWSPGVKPGSKDTWDGYEQEREEIFRFIHDEKIDGVVLMAADRHRSDLRRIPRPDGYDFYELMSSRLTNVHTHGLVKGARGSEFIMGYNEQCSFGRVTFDTTASDPTLEYAIVNIDGEIVGRQVLKRSQMIHGES